MTMKLEGVKNYGDLLAKFRSYDKNNDGYISPDEDPEVKNLDVDGDGRASVWEMMRSANIQQGKTYFSEKEIETAKQSARSMPDVSPFNIVYLILAMESEFMGEKEMKQLFSLINSIIKKIKQEKFDHLPPADKMNRVFQILKEEYNFKVIRCIPPSIKGKSANIFSQKFLDHKLDCIAFAFAFLIIGQELKWPVSLISLPHHIAVRWSDSKDTFTFERVWGILRDFNFYKKFFKIADKSIRSGVFLRPLSEREFIGQLYWEKASVKSDYNELEAAADNLNIAIDLAHQDVHSYVGRINVLKRLRSNPFITDNKKYSRQIKRDFRKLNQLDPLYIQRYRSMKAKQLFAPCNE